MLGWEARYQINTDGLVYSVRKRKVMTPKDTGEGYMFLHLWDGKRKYKRYIHRLVLLSFVGLHEDSAFDEVQHKNGKRADNRLENLEWMTHRLNCMDVVRRRFQREGQQEVPF